MKTRKQRNGYECGPIAVYNALTLLGVKPPSLSSIKKDLGTDRHGTLEKKMSRFIYNLDLPTISYTSSLQLERRSAVFDMLEGAVLILGYEVDGEGHYTTIRHEWPMFFVAYNWLPDKRMATESHKNMLDYSIVDLDWIRDKLKDDKTEIYSLRKSA